MKCLDSDEFDIDARAEAPAAADQLRLMLQTLLTERFHLALSREMKESVQALVVDKGGPKSALRMIRNLAASTGR